MLALLMTACGGGGRDETAKLRGEVAALQQQLVTTATLASTTTTTLPPTTTTAAVPSTTATTKSPVTAATPSAKIIVTQTTAATTAERHQVTGTIEMQDDPRTYDASKPCRGVAGFDDMYIGQQVLINDGAGDVLAKGAINRSEYIERNVSNDPEYGTFRYANCRFFFSIEAVPIASFYTVKVANRAGPTYSLSELRNAGWRVQMFLGG